MINVSNLYQIQKNEKVFIDTNVLIYLFSPDFVSTNQKQIDEYSQILDILLQKEANIYISSVVISEFINRILRINYKKNIDKYPDFKKDYRNSNEYKNSLNLILKQLKKILQISIKIDDNFSEFEILEWYKKDINMDLDFNDLIISFIVENYKFKLLTNDKDFEKFGINIKWYRKI